MQEATEGISTASRIEQERLARNSVDSDAALSPEDKRQDIPGGDVASRPGIRSSHEVSFARRWRLAVVGDLVAIVVSIGAAILISAIIERGPESPAASIASIIVVVVWFASASVTGQYRRIAYASDFGIEDDLGPVVATATSCCWIVVLAQSALLSTGTEIVTPALIWLFLIFTVLSVRSWNRWRIRSRAWARQRVAIVGDPAKSAALRKLVARHPEWGLWEVLAGQVNPQGEFILEGQDGAAAALPLNVEHRGPLSFEGFATVLADRQIRRVLFASNPNEVGDFGNLLHLLLQRGIVVDRVSAGSDALYPGARLRHLEGVTVLTFEPRLRTQAEESIKRIVDLALSAMGLLLFSPVLLLAAIAIKLDSRGPVFFRQNRGGRRGEVFSVLKLRTMVDDADCHREKLRDKGMHGRNGGMLKLENDPRLTRLGPLLRSWSIDELPQLWNVLRGDMSLVGPRPLPLDEISPSSPRFIVRQTVRPGLTGPWQVLGRSNIPMDEMLKLDDSYAVGWSLAGDWKIIVRTFSAVFGRRGVY